MNSSWNDQTDPQFAEALAKPPAKLPYEPLNTLNTLNTRKHARNRRIPFRVFRVFRGSAITSANRESARLRYCTFTRRKNAGGAPYCTTQKTGQIYNLQIVGWSSRHVLHSVLFLSRKHTNTSKPIRLSNPNSPHAT